MIFSCSGGRSGSFVTGRGYLCKGGRSGSSAIFPGSSASTSANVSASCQSSSTGTAMGSGASAIGGGAIGISWSFGRQHFLYFLPLPQGQGSLRPTFIVLSFPHLPRAGNRNPSMIWQSRELACMLDHVTRSMASDESNFTCKGAFLLMEKEQPLCLTCADLDQLVFLPAGDAALSRRARKHSSLGGVGVCFSGARKRYEGRGLLVTEGAWAGAEEECAAD